MPMVQISGTLLSLAALSQAVNVEVQGWRISGDYADNGNGVCFMEATFESGTSITVSRTAAHRGIYLFRFNNEAWRSIQDQAPIQLRVTFDRSDTFQVDARGVVDEFGRGFEFIQHVDDNLFIGSFMVSRSMLIERGSVRVDGFNLEGTQRALTATTECATRLGTRPDHDPFK